MKRRSLLAELQRRNVLRAGALYAAGAWLLVQVATQVFPFFHIAEWVVRWIVVAAVIGFPLALVLSWFYEWTPRGFQLEGDVPPNDAQARTTGRRMDRWIIAVLSLAVVLLLANTFILQRDDSSAASGNSEKSIAVLPFVNMSSDKEQDYFSDGLSEELLNQLAQIPQLRVIARTSSFSFKGREVDISTIAKALNVATILEGSVRKSADTLRVTAQLVRASDSSHLWSQTYDRKLSDVFKVQDEIAGEVVEALKLKLLPSQQPTNLQHTQNSQAYEQFLIANKERKQDGNRASLARITAAAQRAVDLDPQYANAYALLGDSQMWLADYAPSATERAAAIKQAMATVSKAIALAPDLAMGYAVRANLRYRVTWDWEGARADFKKAFTLDPNDSVARIDYSQFLFFSGHPDEAIEVIRETAVLDPISSDPWTYLGLYLAFTGKYPEAERALLRSVELGPNGQWANFTLGYVYLKEGASEKSREAFGRSTPPFGLAGLSMLEYTLGHEKESAQALAELKAKYSVGFAYQIAQACSWRGDKDGAFQWLEHAYEQHDAGLIRLQHDPILDNLRDDPRFAALVKKMGFAE